MTVPRVSVGMPVYNGERYLPQAIDSVLSQTFADLELIISDNASTDATADICREYARRDPRIRYFRNATNIGAARNFNRVFELSLGDYYKLANSDDVAAPELVEKCAAVLDTHPEVVLCYAQTTLIDEDGVVIAEYEDGLDLRDTSVPERFRAVLHRVRLVNVLQGLMRASVLRRTRLEGSYLGSDVVLLEELTLYGQFWEVPRRLFFRRLHDRAASSIHGSVAQLAFIDPSITGTPLRAWRHQFERMESIRRAPLAPSVKLALLAIVLRSAVSDRRTLARELVERGTAVARRWRHVTPRVPRELPQRRP
jgi:glycosyltransferase involved in cell wall biosynthesis